MVTDKQRRALASEVTKARVARNLSMAGLAKDAGINVNTLVRLETVQKPGPERHTVVKVCAALELDPDPYILPPEDEDDE